MRIGSALERMRKKKWGKRVEDILFGYCVHHLREIDAPTMPILAVKVAAWTRVDNQSMGAERNGQKIGWNGTERGAGVAEDDGAESGAGGRGAATERGAGVAENDVGSERGLNRPLQPNNSLPLTS